MIKVKSFILAIALICSAFSASAQSVEQKLDSLQLLIGEQTTLHLTVTANRGQKIVMPSFKPSQQLIPGVEVVGQSEENTSEIDGNRIQVSRNYTLTSFDENVYAIPALNVKVNGKDFHGNPLALKVLTVPVDTVHPNQFYPPKDVQDNPFLWSEWSGIFWLSVLMLLLCVAMYYLLQRLKQNKPILKSFRIVKRVPAHEKALNEINAIKHQRSENQENLKETSSEIIECLQSAGNQKMIDELRQLFRTADLVKFAKYETLINENDSNLVNAINFIDQTKTDEKPVEEKIVPTLSENDKKSQSQRKVIKLLLWAGSLAIVAILVYIVYTVVSLV